MGEAGGEGDLPEEPLAAEYRRELGPQDLEGDPAVMLEILGKIHRRHAPAPELALERVAAGENFLESGEQIKSPDMRLFERAMRERMEELEQQQKQEQKQEPPPQDQPL